MDERLTRDLTALAEIFQAGGWQELRIEGPNLSLLLSIDVQASPLGGAIEPADRPSAPDAPRPPARVAEAPVDPGWHAVTAPNLGTFYRAPKPGAAPFVEVGQRVTADTELCLLEVMKLFTSVTAGVAGTVASIAAADAELVAGGQTLFHIVTD